MHFVTLSLASGHGGWLRVQGETQESASLLDIVVTQLSMVYGYRHCQMFQARAELASILYCMGRLDEAEAI